MTLEERMRLAELRHKFATPKAPSAEPTENITGGRRLLRQGGNLPARILGVAADTLASLPERGLSLLGVESGNTSPSDYTTFEVGAPTTGGDVATDILLEGIAPEIPTLLGGGGLLRGGARLAGLGARGATIAGDTALGAMSGARHSGGESAAQAAEFGALGAVGQMAAPLRPFMRGAANVAAGASIATAGQAARGRDLTSKEALTQIGVMSALPAAQEVFGVTGRKLLRRKEPAQAIQQEAPKIPENWRVIDSVDNGDGTFTTTIETPSGRAEFKGEVQYPVTGASSAAPSQSSVVDPEAAFSSFSPPSPRRFRMESVTPDNTATIPAAEGDVFAGLSGYVPGWNPPRRLLDSSVATRRLLSPAESISPNATVPTAQGVVTPAGQVPDSIALSPETSIQPRKLRPLRKSEAGAASTVPVQYLGSTLAGAGIGGVSDDDNPARGALLGAAIGAGTLKGGRSLMRLAPKAEEAARAQMIGDRTPLGGMVRFLEKNAKLGRDTRLDTILEQSRGTVETLTSDTAAALKSAAANVASLDPIKRSFVDSYLKSDRSPGAELMLRASPLPENVKDALVKASGIKSELQKVVASGERDPEKIKLINDSLGLWQTQQYRAYVQPEKWRPDRKLLDRVVQERMGGRIMANSDEALVRKDAEDWLKEVAAFDGDFSRMANEGKSRISQSLYKERKLLSPAVKKILGEIEDPFEREILSVAKLAKSAVTAKAIGDIMKLPDSKGARFAMTEAEWKAAHDAAEAAGDSAKLKELQGYTRAPSGQGVGGLGEVAGIKDGQPMFVQRQVLDALRAGPGHAGIDWEDGILGTMAKLNRMPKASMTLYNPGSWLRNYAQTALQAVSAGVDPVSLVKNYRKLKTSPTWMRMAREDGILDAHFGAGEFRRQADNFDQLLKPWWRRIPGAIHDKVKAGYGKPDQYVRGATYVKFLEEGIAKRMPMPEARRYAIEATNRYTMNYSNVAQLVGVARNIPLFSPFLTYSAELTRIIKNLAQDVVTNENGRRIPSTVALLSLFGLGGVIKSATAEVNLDEEGRKALNEILEMLPPQLRARINSPVDYDKETGRMRLRNLAPWLPAGDFTVFAKNLLSGDFEAAADRNPVASMQSSPALNMISELVQGRDTYSGRENTGIDRYTRPILKQALPNWFPGIPGVVGPNYRGQQLIDAFTPNEDGSLGITNPSTGRRETPGTAIRGLLGDSVMEVSKKSLIRRALGENEREFSEARRILRRVTNTDAAPAVKERAVEQYQATARRLMQRREEIAAKADQ